MCHTWLRPQTRNMSLMVTVTVLLLVFITIISADGNPAGDHGPFEERTVFGKIKSSFEMAGKFLGIDRAGGVAQLVTDAFGKPHKKGDGAERPGNVFSGFLRVLGFDTKKIGAIAVNAIIFVAQLISSSLSRPTPSQLTEARKIPEGSPFDWMMNSTTVKDMLENVKDKNLPNYITEFIKERSLDEETDCVQLLVCKSAPFVWGMQKALDEKKKLSGKGVKALYAYLPSVDEVADNGDFCETKHPFCFIEI